MTTSPPPRFEKQNSISVSSSRNSHHSRSSSANSINDPLPPGLDHQQSTTSELLAVPPANGGHHISQYPHPPAHLDLTSTESAAAAYSSHANGPLFYSPQHRHLHQHHSIASTNHHTSGSDVLALAAAQHARRQTEAAQAAQAQQQEVPLHRRVRVEGLQGRFLRSIVSALAGSSNGISGTGHILLDLSLTSAEEQSDPRCLASLVAGLNQLFGSEMSCEMLICHPGMKVEEICHGPRVMMQHQMQQHQLHQHYLSTPEQHNSHALHPHLQHQPRHPSFSATYVSRTPYWTRTASNSIVNGSPVVQNLGGGGQQQQQQQQQQQGSSIFTSNYNAAGGQNPNNGNGNNNNFNPLDSPDQRYGMKRLRPYSSSSASSLPPPLMSQSHQQQQLFSHHTQGTLGSLAVSPAQQQQQQQQSNRRDDNDSNERIATEERENGGGGSGHGSNDPDSNPNEPSTPLDITIDDLPAHQQFRRTMLRNSSMNDLNHNSNNVQNGIEITEAGENFWQQQEQKQEEMKAPIQQQQQQQQQYQPQQQQLQSSPQQHPMPHNSPQQHHLPHYPQSLPLPAPLPSNPSFHHQHTDSFSPISPSPDFGSSSRLGTHHPNHPYYRRGAIFANIFILHQLQETSKQIQDLLLQALKMKQIVVDGLPVNLPQIQVCIATHSANSGQQQQMQQYGRNNTSASPISSRLLDEFLVSILADSTFFTSFEKFVLSPQTRLLQLPLPWQSIAELINLTENDDSNGLGSAGSGTTNGGVGVRRNTNNGTPNDSTSPYTAVHISPVMHQYIRDIIIALRQHGRVAFGPSLQGVNAFVHAAKCHAFFGGCNFVRPVDVDSVAEDALCHRVTLRNSGGVWWRSQAARLTISHLIGKVLLPPK